MEFVKIVRLPEFFVKTVILPEFLVSFLDLDQVSEVMEEDSPSSDLTPFRRLIASGSKRKLTQIQQSFVKKLDNIPSVDLPVDQTCRSALNLADKGLIGQFTGLWPSPKAIEGWVQRNWKPLISEGISSELLGKGYFVFLFENVAHRDLIF